MKLPEWYRMASVEDLSEATLEKRSSEITKIASKNDLSWILNCVRSFLGKPVTPEFKAQFVKAFLSDPLFPQKNNDLEIRILSGAILHECMTSEERNDQVTVALSLICGLFGLPSGKLINTDIIEKAKEFVANKSVEVRENTDPIDLDELPNNDEVEDAESLPEVAQLSKTLFNHVRNLTLSMQRQSEQIKVLEEESNIHWWLFRQVSETCNCKTAELDHNIAPIILGKELADLTAIVPGPYPADKFLRKSLNDQSSNERDIVLKDSINALSSALQLRLVSKSLSESLDNLCPLNTALAKAIETGDKTSWVVLFEKSVGIKATYKSSRIELAMQAYLENILLKSLS